MDVVPPQTPAEAPAETDDLFGAPAEEPAAPLVEEAPAETPPAEATPAETPPPAETDDLFGAPAETPPVEGAPAEGAPPAEAAPAETPAEEPAGEEKGETDDIFGVSPNTLQEVGGLASAELRTWTDNTGTFSCRGRIVLLLDGQVRLLKDNGRTTTVPLHRLSAADLEFVNRQASAQQAAVAQTAQAVIETATIAN
jgi:hypothetical protein